MIKFLLFIIVFIFAFGVSTQALLFPNQNLDLNLLGNVFYPSFLVMTGSDYTFKDGIYQAVNFSGIINQLMKLSLWIPLILLKGQSCDEKTINKNYSHYTFNANTDCPTKVGSVITLFIFVFL